MLTRICSFIYWQSRKYGLDRLMSDKTNLKLMFRARMGRKLNLKNPKLYNDKIQWLKLYDNCERYTHLADKYLVKDYVAKIIGPEHIIPTLGVWEKFEDIDFSTLPNQFVLKCNHCSGDIIICKDKSQFDFEKAKKDLSSSLNTNYYWGLREPQYKNIVPRIIAEEYMVDESEIELKDYKFFCFDGEPKLIMVDYDRFYEHKENFYDINWNVQHIAIGYPTDPDKNIEKPTMLDEMLDIARKLSTGYRHVRIDLYSIKDKVYFGEMTFHNGSGISKFSPPEFEKQMGDWITLPTDL